MVSEDLKWDTEAYAGVSEKQGMIVVSFRGTKGLPDSILDAAIWKTVPHEDPDCNCEVEEGFQFAYNTIAPRILDAVALMVKSYPSYRIVVTGHSLGGGMAGLGAVHLAVLYPLKVELYSLATVRVGNQQFVDYLEKLIPLRYRYVHKRDLVPHLPPTFLNFYQYGPEVWQALDGTYKICLDGEDKTCSSSVFMRNPSDHCTYMDLPICHCTMEDQFDSTKILPIDPEDLPVPVHHDQEVF